METAIANVITQYTNMVYSIALTHTANRADADDVFQEVFLAYHRKNPEFADEEHRKAWLIRTTINCSLQITQSSWSKKVNLVGGDWDNGDGALVPELGQVPRPRCPSHSDFLNSEQFTFRTGEQNDVFAAVQALEEPYRTVLQLFYFEDLSIKTISDLLERQSGTVKTQLSRARSMMRKTLKGAYFND
ncbi:DNA-directed RNA polymerase sigma-70 factor [Actinomycetota bacterium]|nr:DNA-directed RNA polymerase sigma-70 factor [Actinomycetota bacterium]